jgi:hypothetical protein
LLLLVISKILKGDALPVGPTDRLRGLDIDAQSGQGPSDEGSQAKCDLEQWMFANSGLGSDRQTILRDLGFDLGRLQVCRICEQVMRRLSSMLQELASVVRKFLGHVAL